MEIDLTNWSTLSTWMTVWPILDALDVCWEVFGGCVIMAGTADDVGGIGVVVDNFNGVCVKMADTGDDVHGIAIYGFRVGFSAGSIDSISEKKINSLIWIEK